MMSLGSNRRRIVLVVIALCLLNLGLANVVRLQAQENLLRVLKWQRISVPEGRIDEVGGELLPIERDEFEKTVAELNAKYRALYGPAKPKIVRARYTARLENGQLINGSAELDVIHPHSELAYLSLSPLGLATEAFRWKSNPDVRAEAGLLTSGDVGVFVARSDTLLFPWSLRSMSGSGSEQRYHISLPEATASEFLLMLPSGIAPECADGLVSRMDETSATDQSGDEIIRWRIELGATNETELRIVPTFDGAGRGRLVKVRPNYDYRIGTTGLELRATFRIDVLRQPLRRLIVQVNPGLRLSTVHIDGEPISFVPNPAEPGQPNQFVLQPASSLLGGPHELIITSYSPIVLNKSWQLPRLSFVDVVWHQGTASLDVVEPLLIGQLEWSNSLLRSFEPLPSPTTGESRHFDLLTSEAACHVLLTRREPQLHAQTETTVTLTDSNVASQFAAQLSASGGAVFSFMLEHDAGWIVDSIESEPPQIDHVEILRGTRGLRREVFLSEPVTPAEPLKLIVKSHRRMPSSRALTGYEMRPVDFVDKITESRLVAVRAELPLQLDVFGDARLDRLTDALDSSQLVFHDGPDADRLRVVLRSEPPRYSGAIVADTLVDVNKIRQSFLFRCKPMSTLVGSLRIRFSPAPNGAMQWSAIGDGQGALVANKMDEAGREWEVKLRRPRDVPFEVRATLMHSAAPTYSEAPTSEDSAKERETIILASLPDAETQIGTVNVGTPDGSGFDLFQEGLTAIPKPVGKATDLPTLRATYRYAPAQNALLQLARHDSQADLPDAWLWNETVTSRVDKGGEVAHLMLLRIENVGAAGLTVDLPENVTLERVDVDGERIVTSQSQKALRIPLPPTRRFPIVRLHCKQDGPPLQNHFRGDLSLPQPRLQCLNKSWRVWIPPGYKSETSEAVHGLANSQFDSANGTDWEHRLFGFPILRRQGRPWNFSSLWSGTDAATTQAPLQSQTKSQVEHVLGAINSQLENAGDTGSTSLTWGVVIEQVLASAAGRPNAIRMYIDHEAMEAAAIAPTSFIPSQVDAAINALRLSDLVFVGDGNSIVLTTHTAQAAGEFGRCVAIGDRVFISNSIGASDSPRFVAAADWLDDLPSSPTPWNNGESNASFTSLVGWTNLRLNSEAEHATIVLYRAEMIDTFGWATLFAAVASGIWMGRRSFRALYVSIVVAIVVALLVPGDLVFVARSALQGLLAASVLVVLRRRVAVSAELPAQDDSLSFRIARRADSVTAGVLLALFVLAVASSQRASAQDQPPMVERSAANVFRVYDPVDQDGQPTGTHIYVSRTFFQSLELLKMTLGTQHFDAIVTEATYSLTTSDMPTATALPELIADYGLISLSEGPTAIRLPFVCDEVQLVEATLDELRVYPRWADDGKSLEIDIETVDRYSLRLKVRPVLASSADGTGFDLQIPKIPNSRLSITGNHAAMIEVQSAHGAVARTDDSIEANLGPIEHLAVQWPVSKMRDSSPAQFTTSQLIWVRAESEVIAVDTQFAFTVLSGNLTEVELQVDPRLQLLTTDSSAQVTETLTPDNSVRTIRYRFDQTHEANDIVTINPSFVMTDVDEGGMLTGPFIRTTSGLVDNPLLAVSSAPGIVASVMAEDDSPPVRPQDFSEVWGAMQLPTEAIQLPTNETNWSLSLKTIDAQVCATEETELRIGRQRADVAHVSTVQISEVAVLQLTIAVPEEMTVTGVKVLQDDVDIARRSSKSPDGMTTIFFTEPIQGQARVFLEGSLPVPPRGTFSFTGIGLTGSSTSEQLVTVLRRPDVLVQSSSNMASRLSTNEDDPHWDAGERVVGVYDMTGDSVSAMPPLALSIAPNRARFSGQLVTKLQGEDAVWSVTADLSLQVSQGVVDAVRVRLPRDLAKSLRLDPPLPFEVKDVPGQSEPTVIITPPAAIDKAFQVTLDAQLPTSPDGSISAPRIEVLDTAQVERLLVLPKQSGEQQIEWNIRGLEQPKSDGSGTTYRVRGRRMLAVVRDVNQSVGSPQLLLADVEVAWQIDASYAGVASYDLVPGDLTRCDVLLPEGVTLVQATVDDVPALVRYKDDSTATLELSAERLPQRISILFVGRALPFPTAARSLTLVAPSLRDLEPRKTLWSVRDPSREATSVPMLNHTMIDSVATRHLRVGVLQEILAYDSGPVPQHRAIDLEHWRERWQQRLNDTIANPRDANTSRLVSVVSLHDGMKWHPTANSRDDWTYCSIDGAAPSLTIIRRARDLSKDFARVARAFVICIAAWVTLKLLRRPGVRDIFSRWPHLPGVVIGLAWWLWLSPSAVGWLIAAAFLANSLRPAWRARPMLAVR
ncbi:MAG: hypothetical protein H8E66_03315 [Planctomycetes bacterium]|nr:hypothetical protein [Planctomycetota bacterium]